MPFNQFHNPSEVHLRFRISYQESPFVEIAVTELPTHLRQEIDFTLRETTYVWSEFGICESLIYPLVREAWKPFRGQLMLWSHQPLRFDEVLCGTPDYMIAQRSPLGKIIQDKPWVILVEAKRNDFELGWGQCLAAMIAAQRLNQQDELSVYGIVSDGDTWEFGRLSGSVFVKHPSLFFLQELDQLFGALTFIMQAAAEQLAGQPTLA